MNELLLRRRVAASKGLPYDAEIEYLESDGSAYIDTNIVLSSSHVIDVTFTYISGQRLVGARNYQIRSFGIYSNYIDIYYNSQSATAGRLTATLVEGNVYSAHAENGNRYFKDDSGNVIATNTYLSNAFTMTSQYHTPVFALRWNAQTASPAKGCIHKLSIGLNGDLLVDFIPVRVGQTGYLYDKVSGQLFGNAGTGDFILGPDK